MRASSSPPKGTGNGYANLNELLAHLSPNRRELIRPVVEHPRDYVLLSVRGLARRLKTDPATTLRIIQSMGFPSYRDFQRNLHELAIAQATPLDLMQTAATSDPIRESMDRDLKNLQGLRHSLQPEQAKQLARRLYQAERIFILGGDLATTLAFFLEYNLTILGLSPLAGTSPGRTMHLVRTAGPRDVLIAISFRRGLRQTVDGLKLARQKGTYCIGITDTFVSPVARYANECFLTSIESPSFGGSYVAPMALLNVLVVACANHQRARTIRLLKDADKEQREGFRWYREA